MSTFNRKRQIMEHEPSVQDEIIEMYLQVSKELCNDTEWCWAGVGEPLQMFAKLVAAKEREACAKVCDELVNEENSGDYQNAANWCSIRIRARGEQAIAELESQNIKQVTVKDFVHIVEGREDLIGRPVYFAQWPNGNTYPPQRTEQEFVKLPCCGYTDASAVKWNPFNRVVQCHNCGQTYTHLPQRTWVGLTDEERSQLVTLCHGWNEYGQAIEAKLKEKT